jgi:signal transduction histidine kinase
MPRNSHGRAGSADGRDALATVAHELKSPIAAVRAAATALRDPELDAASRARLLDVVSDGADQLARLAADLDAALAGTETAVELAATDARAVADEVAAATRAARPDARVDVVADADLPAARADARRLRQILANLVENALAHGAEPVAITLSAERGRLTLAVRDTGAGIPTADAERVFDPGVRLDASRPGSGLGLSVSRELARRMGGDLRYEPGAGGAFVLELTAA